MAVHAWSTPNSMTRAPRVRTHTEDEPGRAGSQAETMDTRAWGLNPLARMHDAYLCLDPLRS
jgi:hypothetical protein